MQVAERFVELLRGDRLPLDIVAVDAARLPRRRFAASRSRCRSGSCSAGTAHVRRFVDPLINFFRALPPIALIPLVIVYFGIGEIAKIVILFYASFFAGVIVMYEGIAQISPIYVRVARTLGATDGEIFRKVIVPLAVPHMLTALRVALGRRLGDAGRLGADRGAAGPRRADPERRPPSSSSTSSMSASSASASSRCSWTWPCARVARRLVSWQERIAS